ncbi:helix-turn-helix transcriptional regulator [Actinoallomurus spadix]|uniref:Helix-turn-helix transcriptional regulator n=1 Tax=Actinoallomurus spadix TaxID=79912 RepID=A0ABP3GZU5_9ACTN|nr:helix-turn-helix transcriptional regulator [Actinoallomurus spadix]MCO5987904.1 helix-turn-helix transcriptional regulator [Actinoallomurus spadix]
MHELRQQVLREFGKRVRFLRSQVGLTGAQLANRAGITQPTVSKIETGQMLPSTEVTERLAEALGVGDDGRNELFALLRRVDTDIANLRQMPAGPVTRQELVSAREHRSTILECFQSAIVPSLLQTAEYARRALRAAPLEDEDVARTVAVRIERQDVLYQPGRRFSFVLTEGALRTCPGSPDVMRAQLAKILDVATLENVSVGVVPWFAAVSTLPLHGFALYDQSAVTVETFSNEFLLEDEHEVAIYRQTFAAFREVGLFGERMRELVSQIAQDYDDWPNRS